MRLINSQNILVSFDGPKGVGKSSLIEAVHAILKSKIETTCCSEKIIDRDRKVAEDLLKKYFNNSSMESDREILLQLARNRAQISRNVLDKMKSPIVLIDRWYPSDIVFRRHLSDVECLAVNLDAGCRIPDLILAITCDPAISWERATRRNRGLDSLVIRDFEGHKQASQVFELAASKLQWTIIRTEKPIDESAAEITSVILKLPRLASFGIT